MDEHGYIRYNEIEMITNSSLRRASVTVALWGFCAAGIGATAVPPPVMGTIKASVPEFTLRLLGDRGMVEVQGQAGAADVATGPYWVLGWSIGLKDAQGRHWTAAAGPSGDVSSAQRVTVRREAPVSVRLAPPVRVQLTADAVGNRVNFRLHFFGPGGEACQEVKVDGVLPPKPWLTIRDSAGKLVERMEFNYGCTFFCSQLWRAPKELKGDYTVSVACDFGPITVEVPAAVSFRLAGVDPTAIAARPGAEAPDFTLKAVEDGTPLQLHGMRPRPTLVCFFCGCDLCAAVAKELARPRAQKPELVALFSAPELCTPQGAKAFRAQTGFRGAILADPGGKVAAAYDSVECPRCWAVDGDGMIRGVNPVTEMPAKQMVDAAVKALFR